MEHVTNKPERSLPDRRYGRDGGRRFSDSLPRRVTSPLCPVCSMAGAALQAGEADGGWWFVCGECDHMWDERARSATLAAGD